MVGCLFGTDLFWAVKLVLIREGLPCWYKFVVDYLACPDLWWDAQLVQICGGLTIWPIFMVSCLPDPDSWPSSSGFVVDCLIGGGVFGS